MLTLIGHILNIAALLFALLLLLPLAYYLTRASFLEKLCRALASLYRAINKTIAGAAKWSILAMALIQITVVIMRYIFGVNFIWLQESILYFFGLSFLLTAGYALLSDEHVRVDIFYREASPVFKARVNLLGTYLFLFPICLLILWAAGPYIARSWAVMEGSQETSGIQAVFLMKSLVPMFAVLLAMAGFTMASEAALSLRSHNAKEAA